MHEPALTGVRVYEAPGGVAGAYCGKLFADMGAFVARASAADDPLETALLAPDLPESRGLYGRYLNAGKARAAPGDAPYDILILGEDTDRAGPLPTPRIATIDISWFGHDGPYADWQGSDLIAQALAGMCHPAGPVDGPPLFCGDHHATQIGGLAAYCAGMAALIGGAPAEPQTFEVSILEAIIIMSEMQMCHAISLDTPLDRRGINRFVPTCPLSIHKCKEGWIGITPITPPQWRAICDMLELPELRDDPDLLPPRGRYPFADRIEKAFDAKFPSKTADEWAEIGRRMKIPMAIVPNAEGILEHPIFNARRSLAEMQASGRLFRTPTTPFSLEETPPRRDLDATPVYEPPSPPLAPATDAMSPLADVRVLDFSMGWAGPLATRMLADLGAEVIKVEAGRYPDWWRGVDWTPEAIARGQYEESRHFSVINRAKKSVSLDLTDAEGLALAKELAATSDIVVENQAAGVMPRLGLGFDDLAAGRDDLIMLSMSAYGSGNAWSETRAYGSVLEQGSGVPSFCGEPDWPPTMAHVAYGDPVGGIYGGAALLTAIYRRKRAGRGQWINNTQIEAMLPFTAAPLLIRQLTGVEPVRLGARHANMSPHGLFRCSGADDWLAIAVQDNAAWPRLARRIGRPDLADDKGLASVAGRRARQDEIEAAISAWASAQSAIEAAAALQADGVAAASVLKLQEIDTNAHLTARSFLYDIERPHIGQQYQAALPFRRNGARYPMRGLAPFLGGDSKQVLKTLTGVDDAAYARLRERGVVSLAPTELRQA